MNRARAPKNRTLTLNTTEREKYRSRLITLHQPTLPPTLFDKTIHQDLFDAMHFLPQSFVDLMIIDPPYNLTKVFKDNIFRQRDEADYVTWFDDWISKLKSVLKLDASLYVCADWSTSMILYPVLRNHFKIQNRITWEREKGRGAKRNWKNACEDIWFCTVSDDYYFDVEAVKLKRRVMAPYRHGDGSPKDWDNQGAQKYRLTHPSNFWTDITVPFWSMPENTDHPTQKPEKLMAKLILASSEKGDLVFDPFLGSGTTSVVAKKLGRYYLGIEREEDYCCWTEKRLEFAATDGHIQGYADGVFWERNTLADQKKQMASNSANRKGDSVK